MADESQTQNPAATTQPASGAPAAQPSPTAGAQPSPAAAAEKAERPAFIDEKYWDGEKGAAKLEDLARDFGAAQTRVAEYDSRFARVPEKPEGYEFALPKDMKLPEGFETEIKGDHPLVPKLQALAHKHGLPPEAFQEFAGLAVELQASMFDEAKQTLNAQADKLGPKAAARIDAVNGWIHGMLGEKGAILSKTLLTASQVEAFEALMQKVSRQGGSQIGTQPGAGGAKAEGIKPDEWARMTPDQKIHAARERGQREQAGGR